MCLSPRQTPLWSPSSIFNAFSQFLWQPQSQGNDGIINSNVNCFFLSHLNRASELSAVHAVAVCSAAGSQPSELQMAHRGGIGEENPWVKWAGGSSWSVSVPGLWSSSWHPERGSIAGLPCRHQQGPSVLGSFPSFFPVGVAEHREGNVQFQWAEQSSVFLFVVLSCWSSVLCDFDKKLTWMKLLLI